MTKESTTPISGTDPPPFIAGGKVYLRFPLPMDQAEYLRLRIANRPHLAPWEPLPPLGVAPGSPAEFDRFIQTANTGDSKRLLVFRSGTRTMIGRVSLGNIIHGPLEQAFLGYWIGHDAQGQGLMREAIELTLAYAFAPTLTHGGLGLHRIECNVMPTNARSLALARRLGFREEGFSPRYLQIAGAWADHVRFAMTAEDWHALRATQR